MGVIQLSGKSLTDFQLGVGVGALLAVFAGWVIVVLALSVVRARADGSEQVQNHDE